MSLAVPFSGLHRLVQECLGRNSALCEGVQTVGDLRNVPLAKLRELFGEKQAQSLFRLCRGIDDRPWDPRPPRKSVGAQIAWGVRFEDSEALRRFVAELTTEALRRLARHGRRGSSLTVKVWKARPDAPHCGGWGFCFDSSESLFFPLTHFPLSRRRQWGL